MCNRLLKWIVAFVLLLFLKPGFTQERLRLVHADSMVQVEAEHKAYVELWGDVQLVQGNAFLYCDYAQWQNRLNKIKMFNHVQIYDGKRKLFCDQMIYDGDKKMEHASGNVHFQDRTQHLTSDHLKYWQNDEVVLATGNAKLSDDSMLVWLVGDSIYYNRLERYAKIPYAPQLFYADTTTEDTLHIESVLMEAWEDLNWVSIQKNVQINKGEMVATSNKAEYNIKEELFILTDHPIVKHGNQKMTGDTIHVKLVKNKFQGVNLIGRGEMIEEDSTGKEDKLSGMLIQVFAKNDTINKIVVEGQASSLYHVDDEESDERGSNLITGDKITIHFKDRKLSEILVQSDPGYCTGEFIPEGVENKKSASRKPKS